MREPLSHVSTSDIVFMTLDKDDAIRFAQDYANQTGFRVVVALLHNDIYWH